MCVPAGDPGRDMLNRVSPGGFRVRWADRACHAVQFHGVLFDFEFEQRWLFHDLAGQFERRGRI